MPPRVKSALKSTASARGLAETQVLHSSAAESLNAVQLAHAHCGAALHMLQLAALATLRTVQEHSHWGRGSSISHVPHFGAEPLLILVHRQVHVGGSTGL